MKGIFSWGLAVIITLGAVYVQRSTGPSQPEKQRMEVNAASFAVSFPRSLVRPANRDPETLLTVTFRSAVEDRNQILGAVLYYKRYPSDDPFKAVVPSFSVDKEKMFLNAEIPVQPSAGKITYYIQLIGGDGTTVNSAETTLRFRDHVPGVALILHILFVFFAFLFSNFTGIYAFARDVKINPYALITIIMLFTGGFILGPLVQKYAFGVWWSGWPAGGDMTDNKTLIALLTWAAVYMLNRIPFASARFCRWRRFLYLAAALVTMAVYSIPHSTAGSQYNYEKGTIVTGRDQTTEHGFGTE